MKFQGSQTYVATQDLMLAVNAASTVQRPLRVKGEALAAIRAARVEPVERAEITLHWLIPDRRVRDADNLFPTLKACQDALVTAGILHRDHWQHVPAATCRIHPPDGAPARMWLTLTPP